MNTQATHSAGADWDWPPVWRPEAGTGAGGPGRRLGLDGTGSWQCRPKAGTGTGVPGRRPGLAGNGDLSPRLKIGTGRENRPNLVLDRPVFTCYGCTVAHRPLVCVISAQYTLNTLSLMHIWHQNQCFDRSVTGPHMGLDGTGSWQCRPKAGTGTGVPGRRPGLAGTGDLSPRLKIGTEAEVHSYHIELQSSVRHCVSLG